MNEVGNYTRYLERGLLMESEGTTMETPGLEPMKLGVRYPNGSRYYCGKCHHYFGTKLESEKEIPFIEWNYCPNCGTHMKWKRK